jgi:undecaprenyl-diphosphatase
MNLFQALVLGIIQGATEFIPISSSGHLVLVPWILGWEKAPLAFDTTVHWGTLVAVIAVFWEELWELLTAGLKGLLAVFVDQSGYDRRQARLAWGIILASVPAGLAGLLFEDFFEDLFGRPTAAAALLLVTAGILVLSERISQQERTLVEIRLLDAVFIGVAQALAIMPGISRSGATIAAGLTRGVRREAAARFSFLLSVPVIFGAGLANLLELLTTQGAQDMVAPLIVGFVTAAVTGYLCIRWLLRFLARRPLFLFAGYCLAFGLFNLVLAMLRG